MKIIKNYLYNCSYQLLTVLVPLITTPYLSRVLLAENIGISSYVLSVSTIFSTLGLIGLTSYSAREIAYARNNNQKCSKIFWELSLLRILCFIITFSLYMFLALQSQYRSYLLIQSIWLFSTFLDFTWYFTGIEDFKISSFRNILVKIINLACIFMFIKQESDLGLYLFFNGFCQILGSIAVFPIIKKNLITIKLSELNIFQHLIPTIKILLPQIAGILYLQIDKVMIEFITTNASYVGFYDQAEKIIKIPLTIITTISTVLMPRVAYSFRNKNEISRYINISIYISLALATPLTFGIVGISDSMVPWFFGSGFEPVSGIMKYLSLIIIFISMTSISSNQYFIATDKTNILTISYLVSGITNLAINWVLIPIYGVYGAILGTISAELVAFIIQFIFMKKHINYTKIFFLSFKFLIYSIIMYIFIFYLTHNLPAAFTTTLLQIVIGITCYSILLLIFHKKHKKDISDLMK